MADEQSIQFKDRGFTDQELRLIREVVSSCSGLSRLELANTICELLNWRRPNGGLKTWECRDLLGALETAGQLRLPALRTGRPRGARTSVPRTLEGERQATLRGTLADVGPILLELVVAQEQRRLWRELVGRYHYLGHAVPFGAHLRYLVEVSRPTRTVVGCVQLSSPAWRMAVRDRWIGWSDEERRRNLQRVVNNSRFLRLPWVEVRYLASSVLSLVARRLPSDWEAAYGVRPLLLETLVESKRHTGACYRAANWIELGTTRGRGRMDRERKREGASPKTVLVYPLVREARKRLRGDG
jgi:hypothetical protein